MRITFTNTTRQKLKKYNDYAKANGEYTYNLKSSNAELLNEIFPDVKFFKDKRYKHTDYFYNDEVCRDLNKVEHRERFYILMDHINISFRFLAH